MVVTGHHEYLCEEEKRLKDDRERKKYWKQFGPYVQLPSKTVEKTSADWYKGGGAAMGDWYASV